MKKNNLPLNLNNIGLIKIFSSLDTQSAIVAALTISIMTFLVTGFSNLCNYIYWSAYFNKFNIPLTYIDEAIIQENSIKYLMILCVPMLIFVWWFFNKIKNATKNFISKITKNIKNKSNQKLIKALKYLYAFVLLSALIAIFPLLLESNYTINNIIRILYIELLIFVLWNISKATLGHKFTFTKKKYYTIRLVFIVFIVYALMATVYFSGCFENYDKNGVQPLQIVNNTDLNYNDIDPDDEIQSQLILFETEDYYYITDITITNRENGIKATIKSAYSYRFIDKADCPVKTINAYLWYNTGRHNTQDVYQVFSVFITISFITTVIFIALLGIPKREEDENEDYIEHLPVANNIQP